VPGAGVEAQAHLRGGAGAAVKRARASGRARAAARAAPRPPVSAVATTVPVQPAGHCTPTVAPPPVSRAEGRRTTSPVISCPGGSAGTPGGTGGAGGAGGAGAGSAGGAGGAGGSAGPSIVREDVLVNVTTADQRRMHCTVAEFALGHSAPTAPLSSSWMIFPLPTASTGSSKSCANGLRGAPTGVWRRRVVGLPVPVQLERAMSRPPSVLSSIRLPPSGSGSARAVSSGGPARPASVVPVQAPVSMYWCWGMT
jgi:hypothetical protein